MSTSINCPRCQTELSPRGKTAQKLRCPECRALVSVPDDDEELETAEELDEEIDERPKKRKPKKRGAARGRGFAPLLWVGASTVLATAGLVGVLALTGALPGRKPAQAARDAEPPPPPTPPLPAVRPAPGPPKRPVPPPPAPAAEEADPLRPVAPQAAATVRRLNELADRLPPIPQDAARAKALRAARLEATHKVMDLAFDKFGRTDAPWAEKARAAFLLRAKELAARSNFSAGLDSDHGGAAALAAAVAAGCDDPMVLYFHNRALVRAGDVPRDQNLAEARKAANLVWDSRYPDLRKMHVAHNFLAALHEFKGPRDEIGTWDARFLEVLGRVCRDKAPTVQDHVFELAPLREQIAISAGRTREEAHKEYAAVLAKAGAPEYTLRALEGAFLIRHGWDARGRGTADTVTQDGFRLLAERLEKAEEALVAAFELDPDRPHAPTSMLTVCMGRGHPRAEMEKWFERAMRADPDNVLACSTKLEFLHTKWYGTHEEYIGFAWQCVRARGTDGVLPYASVSNLTANASIPYPVTPAALIRLQPYYSHPDIWTVIDAALTVLRRDCPDMRWLRGLHGRVACVAGRYDVATRELTAIGDDRRGWGFWSAASLNFYQTWARDGRLPPPPPEEPVP